MDKSEQASKKGKGGRKCVEREAVLASALAIVDANAKRLADEIADMLLAKGDRAGATAEPVQRFSLRAAVW